MKNTLKKLEKKLFFSFNDSLSVHVRDQHFRNFNAEKIIKLNKTSFEYETDSNVSRQFHKVKLKFDYKSILQAKNNFKFIKLKIKDLYTILNKINNYGDS